MSALAGTVSAPFAAGTEGIDVGRWLRSTLSLLVAIGVLVIALPVAFSNGAPGSGTDSVEVFSSGSLVSVEADGSAQLSISGLVPGESRAATVHVANTGSASAAFSLTAQIADQVGSGGGRLSDALVLRIESTAGKVLYSGPIGGMSRLGLGSIAAGAERAYRFAIALPESVGNEVEGSSMSAGFAWNASA